MSSHRRKRSIFDLIDEYIEEMESLAEELVPSRQPTWNINTRTIEPLCNVLVTPDEVIVTADLPFSDPDSVTVEPIDKKTLEIRAKINRRICCGDLGITHQKGEFSTFNCQTHIPVPVDMKKKKVKFKKGILEVRLPRKRGYEIKVE
jgi:HSP20 family molecular chaperone IbpA